MLLKSFEHALQCVSVLLAQGMEVQSFDAVQEFRFELGFGHAEARKLSARVVQVGLDCRKLRVDSDACAHTGSQSLLFEPHPLAEAVEGDVARARKNLVYLVVIVDRGEYMDFLAHFFFGESSLVQARGGGSGEVISDKRKAAPETVPF